jgi:hypothetical protein
MKRYFVLKDSTVIGSTATKSAAVDMVKSYQAQETHYMLRANFSIIDGEEEDIPYSKIKKGAGQ